MSRVHLQRDARTDLQSIWDYTAENWGVQQADKYLAEINVKIREVAFNRSPARRCDEIHQGLWRSKSGSHIILFLREESGISVVRVMHMRQNFTAAFDQR